MVAGLLTDLRPTSLSPRPMVLFAIMGSCRAETPNGDLCTFGLHITRTSDMRLSRSFPALLTAHYTGSPAYKIAASVGGVGVLSIFANHRYSIKARRTSGDGESSSR